jgi:hypothetical protein
MNEGKGGAPFEYSHSYIHFLAFLKIGFKIAYRTVQGIVRGLSDYIRIEDGLTIMFSQRGCIAVTMACMIGKVLVSYILNKQCIVIVTIFRISMLYVSNSTLKPQISKSKVSPDVQD